MGVVNLQEKTTENIRFSVVFLYLCKVKQTINFTITKNCPTNLTTDGTGML